MRITRNNRIYKWLLTLNRRQRFVLTTSIIICIVASWFFLLYQPIVTRTRLCQKKMDSSKMDNTQCQSLHTTAEQLEQTISTLEQNSTQNKHALIKKNGDYLTTITKLARQATVCIDSCTLEPFEEKQNFTILPLAIQGHGTLAQLADLLNKIFMTYTTASPSQITLDHIKNNVFQFNFRLNLCKAS